MVFSDLEKKLISVAEKHPEFDRDVVVSEIEQMREQDVIPSVKSLLDAANEFGPGDSNNINSLLLYCLGVTFKRPEGKYHLDKRRTYARSGFPDIDMDFDYLRRHEIVTYLRNKYGHDRVASIGTIQRVKTKAALQRVIKAIDATNTVVFADGKESGKNQNIELASTISKSLPNLMKTDDGEIVDTLQMAYHYFNEFRQFMDAYPEVRKFAGALEGVTQGYSAHAAGIVISPVPLEEICPVHYTAGSDDDVDEDGDGQTVATMFPMADVESLGLIKFDVLGLSTKTAVAWCAETIKNNTGKDIDLANLPLDDRRTLTLLNSGKTDLCFQLENPGMQKTLQQIKIDNFTAIVTTIAMYRPGPMAYIPELSDRKSGRRKVVYDHPLMEQITKPTYGVICFQEQVLQAFMSLANMTATAGYEFLKGCAKKKEDKILKYRDSFIKGCKNNGIDEEVANKIWADLKKFAGYAFNKTLHFSEGIITSKGEYSIEELFHMKRSDLPKVYSPEGDLVDIVDVYDHGVVPMVEVEFSDGSKHKCTAHHKFFSTDGVLPLHEIIEKNSRVIVNRRISDSRKKKCVMPRLWGSHIIDRSVGSQASLREVENSAVSALRISECEERTKTVEQIAIRSRVNDGIPGQNVHSCEQGDYGRRGGKTSPVRVNENTERNILRCLSEESNCNCNRNIISSGNNFGKNETAQGMERVSSRRILRKMHQKSNATKGVALQARNTSYTHIAPNGIQAFSNCDKQIIPDKIQTKTSGFSGSGSQNHGRVRRGATFSGWLWEATLSSTREGQYTEHGNDVSWVFGDSNIMRHMGASTRQIQVYRNGSFDRDNNQRDISPEASIDRQEVSVVSIRYIGMCQGYDLEVNSKDHLYCLSTGVVNSNSHSVSYAVEAFKCAYLKAHYPTEFFEARLSVENIRRKFDTVEKYEMDAVRNFGFKVIPPDINRSETRYKIVGDKVLLRPILQKGIGIKAAEEIAKHKPYTGDMLESFVMKVNNTINSRVVETMHDLGLWPSYRNKSKLLKDFETLKSDKKKNISEDTDGLYD